MLRKITKPKRHRIKVKFDTASGFPYFDTPKGLPPITDEWVKEQLANFP